MLYTVTTRERHAAGHTWCMHCGVRMAHICRKASLVQASAVQASAAIWSLTKARAHALHSG